MDAQNTPESNTLVATAVLASAVMMDAFTAHDGAEDERPSALRGTAIVLILCTAGPPLREWLAQAQRLVLLALLAAVALLGRHVAAEPLRVADALYVSGTLLVILTMHRLFPLEMADGRVSKELAPWARREATTALPCALLFYAGLRQVRAAAAHAGVAADLRTRVDGLIGYAHASGTSTVALAFSGGAAAAIAALVMLSGEVRVIGTAAAAPTLVVAALAQLAGAFVATMAYVEQVTALPALFASGACIVDDACEEARRARRMAQANASPALAWLAALGTLVLAFAPAWRPMTRGEGGGKSSWLPEVATPSILYPALAAAACIWSVQLYCTFEGAFAVHEWAAVVAIVGAFATPFFDPQLGGTLFAGALLFDQVSIFLNQGGAAYAAHPTFSAILVSGGALVVHLFGSFTLDCSWSALPARWKDFAEYVMGLTQVAGTSVAVLLYCGTATLFGTLDGTLPPEAWLRPGSEGRHARSLAAFAVIHFLPALVWLGCIATRCEASGLTSTARATAWVVAGLVTPLVWAFVRQFAAEEAAEQLETDATEPLDQTVHRLVAVGPFWVGVALSTVVPWFALAFA